MPGYSGTPLPKKLGIKDGYRVALIGMPGEIRTDLKEALSKCRISNDFAPALDFIHIFTKSHVELEREMKRAAKALAPAGMVWISWPKKSSGVATDLTEDTIRATGLALGLVDVKVCAVTDVWSGLKFVIPVKDRLKV
jgi:hypothetical protein